MPKPVELLEKNVQWLTLGAGVAFLGFVGYRYFVNQPTVTVGGTTLGAGQVDPSIAGHQAAALEEKINAGYDFKPVVPTFDKEFAAAFNGPTTRPFDVAFTTARPLTVELTRTGAPVNFDPNAVASAGAVSALAALPAPTPLGVINAVSTLNTTQFVQLTAANVPAPAQPGQPPVIPVIPPTTSVPGSPAPTLPPIVDKDWVSVSFSIPMADIAKAWNDSKIRGGLTTSFLRVEVERQQLLPDGSWGNATPVSPLPGSPLALSPYPAAGNQAAETAYRSFADAQQSEILQPSFFAIVAGTGWTPPGIKAEPTAAAAFDPATYTGPLNTLTEEERKAVLEARRKAAQAREAERRQNQPRGGPGGANPFGVPSGGTPYGPGGGFGGPRGEPRRAPEAPRISLLPQGQDTTGLRLVAAPVATAGDLLLNVNPLKSDTDRASGNLLAGSGLLLASGPVTIQGRPPIGQPYPGQPYPGQPYPGQPYPGRPGVPYAGPGNPFGGPGGEGPQYGGTGIATNLGQVPSGAFDPNVVADSKVNAFAHDINVEPGATYRYRCRYVLANPVYQQPNAVSNPALASQFGWESQWSGWTENVSVAPTVAFFIPNNISAGAPTVQFELFKYDRGVMKSKFVSVAPGDPIGTVDPQLGDLYTGYVLVDIRTEGGRNAFVLIQTPAGNIVRRDTEGTTPEYQAFRKQVAAAAPANPTPAP